MFHITSRQGQRQRRWSRRHRLWGVSFLVAFLVAVYALSTLWGLHQIERHAVDTAALMILSADPSSHYRNIKSGPEPSSLGMTQHHRHNNNNNNNSNIPALHDEEEPIKAETSITTIRVLILVASIPRTPETICATLQAIDNNFLSASATSSSSRNTEMFNHRSNLRVEPPVVLVHRYGPWTCDPHAKDNSYDNLSVIVRDYPPHERVSNMQQTRDYLHLMQHGLDYLGKGDDDDDDGHSSSFSHVMFLDDDVELCPQFSDILSLIHKVAPHFTLAHLGRGGSGVLVKASNLAKLRESVLGNHQGHHRTKPKNIDKTLLEWALQVQQGCTVRPTTIHMRHMGLESRLHPGQIWGDVDQCGNQPSNNRAWQSLSENSLHHDLFSEYCGPYYHSGTWCSPYSSVSTIGTGNTNDSSPSACDCLPGFTGSDCGVPVLPPSSSTGTQYYVRRKFNAPIVVLLSSIPAKMKAAADTFESHDDLPSRVLADARMHQLVNLYVLGNAPLTQWLADNVYASTFDARHAFEEELRNSSRFGAMAFPIELVVLDKLLPPQELWTLKYYDVVQYTNK